MVCAAAGVPIKAPKATTETGMGFAAASGSDAYAKQYEEAPKGVVSQPTTAVAPLAASGDKAGWMLPPPPPPPLAPVASTACNGPPPPQPLPSLPLAPVPVHHQPPTPAGALVIASQCKLYNFQDAFESVTQEAEHTCSTRYLITRQMAQYISRSFTLSADLVMAVVYACPLSAFKAPSG